MSSQKPSLPRSLRIGSMIAGKYEVEAVIGSGGMGTVLRARHCELNQRVALKIVGDEEPDGSTVARFLREARAAARLKGEHIVRIYDVDRDDAGRPFMVMELLEGSNLSERLAERGPLGVKAAIAYLKQACDAVAEAHGLGIVHRDLKPSNLFVALQPEGPELIKVLDFGISKFLKDDSVDGTLTDTRSVMGSPHYMSPEQVRDAKHVDERTDIWALGAILHELLTGKPAFEGDTLPSICAKIVTDSPRSVREIRSEVPKAVSDLVARCLNKDPDERFQSAAELRGALEAAGSGIDPGFDKMTPESSEKTLRSETGLTGVSSRTQAVAQASASGLRQRNHGDEASGAFEDSKREPDTAGSEASAPQAVDTSSRNVTTATGARWRLIGFAVLAISLPVGGGLIAAILTSRTAPPAEPTQETLPDRFPFTLSSSPTGADVYDGSKLIGVTPLKLTLVNSELRGRERIFTVRLSGYRPQSVSRGPSASPVEQHITLTALAISKAKAASPIGEPRTAASEPPAPHARRTREVGTRPIGQSAVGGSAPERTSAEETSSTLGGRPMDLRTER